MFGDNAPAATWELTFLHAALGRDAQFVYPPGNFFSLGDGFAAPTSPKTKKTGGGGGKGGGGKGGGPIRGRPTSPATRRAGDQPASWLRTRAATRLPSARPATLGVTTFITCPMPPGPDAPVSAIAAATIAVSSSSLSCAGR